jgi:hypothetical protein
VLLSLFSSVARSLSHSAHFTQSSCRRQRTRYCQLLTRRLLFLPTALHCTRATPSTSQPGARASALCIFYFSTPIISFRSSVHNHAAQPPHPQACSSTQHNSLIARYVQHPQSLLYCPNLYICQCLTCTLVRSQCCEAIQTRASLQIGLVD